MKATALTVKKEFEPVTLNLTFETLEELQEFYAVFNYTRITDSLRHINSFQIKGELEKLDQGAYSPEYCEQLFARIVKLVETFDIKV